MMKIDHIIKKLLTKTTLYFPSLRSKTQNKCFIFSHVEYALEVAVSTLVSPCIEYVFELLVHIQYCNNFCYSMLYVFIIIIPLYFVIAKFLLYIFNLFNCIISCQ